jgi:hypothetical protein
MVRFLEGPLVAGSVSRRQRQKADVRQTPQFFNGCNVARTPRSAPGHQGTFDSH